MRSKDRRRALVLSATLVALGTGLSPRSAAANEVKINETIGCSSHDCIDVYKIKCTQSSRFICVTIDGKPSGGQAFFILNAVATKPTAAVGDGFMRWAGNSATASCVERPFDLPEGSMTVLASVGASFSGSEPRAYKVKAKCVSWATGSGVSRATTATLMEDH